ncbi:MAG: toll/interleukin-1 receptor domain-containing protein [Acidobacteriota bacterium]
MIKIDFDEPDLDSLIQQTVQQHIASAVAAVICPVHGTRLESVHIAGEVPDLQIQMKGCCDEILSLANRALGASEDGMSSEQEDDTDMPAETDRSLRTFICHASEDKELASRLANDLHAAGIDTFFAEWEIKAGDSLRRKIDEGIESCTHFIVLLTPRSREKPWVNAEIDAAFVRKVGGQSILIPLRHQLGVDRLPPLLAALLSPEIREYEEDVKELINDIRGLTRKPPVASVAKQSTPSWGPNLALSPLAAQLAELFAQRSEHGRAWDPQFGVEEMKEATAASDNDLIDAISELEDLGWVEPQRVMGAAPYGYQFATPTDGLFEHVDLNVMGWDPAQDALRVAAEVVNSSERGLQAHELVERLGWNPRRLNPALSYLVSRDLVLSSQVNDPVFVTHYIAETPKTRRFARNAN